MGSASGNRSRRRGRPPGGDSADTRQTILDVARRLFADRGYAAVTNKDLATAAGVTTGALYHYVESKLDLYCQVHADMQERIYERFQKAEASETTFVGKLEAVLDTAHELNAEDPSLARFVGTVRSDVRLHPDVRDRLGAADATSEAFFVAMVDRGVATGEIAPEDRELVREFVRLVLNGLTGPPSDDPVRHRRAIDAIKAAVGGRLVAPARPT